MSLMDLDASLGSVLIGTVVAAILWGITCSQVFDYYTTRPCDSVYIKMMVLIIWVCDTTHQFLVLINLYDYCVTHFGDYDHLLTIPRSGPAETALMHLMAMIVQAFYILKIWRLCLKCRYRWFVLFIAVLCLAGLGLAIANVYINATTDYLWFSELRHVHYITIAYAVVAFATDTSITGMMCYILWNCRTEYVQTNSIITKITVFVMSSNMLTACCALTGCLIFVFYPYELYFIPLYFIIVRLYANSFLAALNMRPYLTHNHRAPFEVSQTSSRHELGQIPLWKARLPIRNETNFSYDRQEIAGQGVRVAKVIDISPQV